MNNTRNRPDRTGVARLTGILRAFAEGSLVAVAFAAAMLLIGTPIALLA